MIASGSGLRLFCVATIVLLLAAGTVAHPEIRRREVDLVNDYKEEKMNVRREHHRRSGEENSWKDRSHESWRERHHKQDKIDDEEYPPQGVNEKVKNFPDKVLAGYACNITYLDAQKIIDSGFNFVVVSFFDTIVTGGQLSIAPNKCCGASYDYNLANALLAKGVIVSISIGGDGCQGAPPSGLDTLSADALVAGFESFRASSGVNWSGIDFDWEGWGDDVSPKVMNNFGAAFASKGYFVTTAPMSSQFNPGGLQGWKALNPTYVDLAMPQWYQGGCVGTQSCPCWGPQPISTTTCPGFTQSYMQQSAKCGIKQWVDGFSSVGPYNWSPYQIVIGAKSWCGGDIPSACAQSDTGIWGWQQIVDIVTQTKVRGVYIWDLNDYYNDAYYATGNPINTQCQWANHIAQGLGLPAVAPTGGDTDACKNYNGPLAQNCISQYAEHHRSRVHEW